MTVVHHVSTTAPSDAVDVADRHAPPAKPALIEPGVNGVGGLVRAWAFMALVAFCASVVADHRSQLWLIPVVLVASTVIHQVGHVLGARLMGFEVLTVRVGYGPRVARLRIAGTPVTVGAGLRDGYVMVGTTDGRRLRRRVLAFALSGVGLCLLTAGAVAVVSDPLVRFALLVGAALQLANLLPFGFSTQPRAETDGALAMSVAADDPDLPFGVVLPLRLFRVMEAADVGPAAAQALVAQYRADSPADDPVTRLLALAVGSGSDDAPGADDLAFLLDLQADHEDSEMVQALTAVAMEAVVAQQLRGGEAADGTDVADRLAGCAKLFPIADPVAWELAAT